MNPPAKLVPGAGRVEHVFQQIARRHEVAVAAEQDGAVFAALDHQGVRPHLQDLRRRAPQVVLAGKQARLAVVDQQEIPLPDASPAARRENR